MSKKSQNGRVALLVLIMWNVATLFGCATSYESGISSYDPDLMGELSSDERDEVYAALSHEGQFTKATLLKNLHDPNALDVSGSGMASIQPNEDKAETHAQEKKVQAVKEKLTQNESIAQESALLVHLPSGPPRIESQDEQWHKDLGWSLLIEGNYEGAAAAYREALRQNQDSAEAYLGLGSSLRMQHHIPAAIEAYEHAIQLQPDYTAALVHLGSIYAEGDPEHQDIERAKQMYARASEQGDPFAKIALKDLNTRK